MKDSHKEKELDQLFNQHSTDDSFGKIINKAKRKTIFRNAVISVFVLGLFTIAAGIGWLSIMRWQEAKALRDIELFSQITDPNIEEMGPQQQSNGLFESFLRFERYKVIEGIPVDWSEETITYSLFGGVSGFSGDHSYIQIVDEATDQMKFYDRKTKQRVLGFYHPEVEYAGLADGLGEFGNFPEETIAELALSFDQAYTPEQIRESLPEEVTLKWYWIDTYSSDDLERMNQKFEGEFVNFPELSDQVYGIEEFQFDEEIFAEEEQPTSEEGFVNRIQEGMTLENGKYFSEYKRIHDLLKGGDERLTSTDVKVIGAVVTGTKKNLQALEDMPIVRASALGVTVSPYQ
ncbi:anti sigma factor C-terminal domain-containing protein [Planococcus sp. NCCP-2050]|uniref:anti sigma factor C-terminal domain-containing protein n=1 Tax=Planococcus sp. NCCP-2050 TaxID=2944679 RepID=UPI00203FC2AC|nr:anti sigma factor C-terminal domain-containing protein [Planococcus sp. NCCP-2050]GKW45957.1 hypothetical protein NCCP2050_16490 [Planococcus sp. NCCP-2050]